MDIVAIIQAREGSTRFPEKVIRPLGSSTSLMHCYRACNAAKSTTNVVVATGSIEKNTKLISYCTEKNINVIDGSDEDVLSRYLKIAMYTKANIIVRITADCPLIRSHLIDECVGYVQNMEFDYCCLGPEYAEGVDVEAFTFQTLVQLNNISQTAIAREHVTYELHRNTELFKIKKISADFNHEHIRLTLDHPEDYAVLTKIFDKYEYTHTELSYHELINIIQSDEKQLLDLNAHIIRNEAINE